MGREGKEGRDKREEQGREEKARKRGREGSALRSIDKATKNGSAARREREEWLLGETRGCIRGENPLSLSLSRRPDKPSKKPEQQP